MRNRESEREVIVPSPPLQKACTIGRRLAAPTVAPITRMFFLAIGRGVNTKDAGACQHGGDVRQSRKGWTLARLSPS
jgi:hypothetical protein